MRPKRLLLASLVALGLAPGLVVRAPPTVHDFASPVRVTPLGIAPQSVGELQFEAGWIFESENDLFGGWSAMVEWLDDSFLAGSDSGRVMVFARPDRADPVPRLSVIYGLGNDKRGSDLESLSRDPATDELWAGFENTNSIMRIVRPLRPAQVFSPPAMADWPENGGAESLVRLADGSLLVIAERAGDGDLYKALLFPPATRELGDPVSFFIQGHEDYRPADAAALPDGRLLVLLRTFNWGLPLEFPTMLVLVDPSGLAQDAVLPSRQLARLPDSLPSDNFEGMAITREGDNEVAIWLISDDNSWSLQQTTLLKLTWDGTLPSSGVPARQKARR